MEHQCCAGHILEITNLTVFTAVVLLEWDVSSFAFGKFSQCKTGATIICIHGYLQEVYCVFSYAVAMNCWL